jgi:amidophosphoribosyltransferase
VHFRVSSPPYRWPCFYGMDTGRRSELLAADMSVGEIADFLNVDSLAYLELDRVIAATGAQTGGFCTACLSGRYPVAVPLADAKLVLEKAGTSGSGMPAPDAEPIVAVGDADRAR